MNEEERKEKRPADWPDRIIEMHSAAMREMSEPRDGIHPTPVGYIIACFFLTMWGGWYIGTYAGDWTGNGLAELRSTVAAAPRAPQNPMVLGKEVYNACSQCHQGSGAGLQGSFPPLAESEYVNGDPRRLAAILLNGLNGELVVKGQTYNSQMPAWKDSYDDEEIAAVLTFIRSSFGNKSEPVSKALVEAVRKEVGAGSTWNAQSLAEFAAKK